MKFLFFRQTNQETKEETKQKKRENGGVWWIREGTYSTGGDSYYLEVNVEVEVEQIKI